jgi:NADPH-dependent curcumin reductase CurA
MTIAAREIHLKSRPSGLPGADNFQLVERTLPAPAAGQLLIKTLFMSVDPYMRGRMTDRPSYIAPFEIGQPLEGSAVGVVEQSAHPDFITGDLVSHFSGWRDHVLVDAAAANKIDITKVPLEAWLGPLGIPGHTAYVGLLRIAELKAGETVFVSAAAGAVGSMAVQIAKLKGARVIGSVGSEEKARWVRELGADAVINYKTAGDLTEALRKAAPEGIDVYFDNVGGDHLRAALEVAKPHARFAICGMIAGYNDDKPVPGPDNLAALVIKSISMRGFLVLNHFDILPEFIADMSGWMADGRVTSRDTVVSGLENAPQAVIGLFSGENLGKMLVKLA